MGDIRTFNLFLLVKFKYRVDFSNACVAHVKQVIYFIIFNIKPIVVVNIFSLKIQLYNCVFFLLMMNKLYLTKMLFL